MPSSNYINLEDAELDRPIFRIMPINRLLQAFDSRRLVLAKPKLWDDPFENALLSAAFLSEDGSKSTFAAKDSVYGQCWTQHRETDAMWRIYSSQRDGARVTTTPRRLFDALTGVDPTFWQNRCYVGKVAYQSQKDLLRILGGIKLLRQDGSGVAESLLYKRWEFRHEREVRLIYTGDDMKPGADLCPFEVDPLSLFSEVTFDPRMDDTLVEAYTMAIERKGFPSKAINKSPLYRAPKGLVFKL
jgi:hypothetical protein